MATQRPFWIGTSWKMNKTLAEATLFAKTLAAAPDVANVQRFVIPPFTAVREVKRILRDTTVQVGAQNMHWADQGAWTGEVSPVMLRDCDLDLVELGHFERRNAFGETDETVALKVEAAIRHGLTPLICVGETREQREAGQARDVLSTQITAAFSRLSPAQRRAPIVLAYEPLWAIGVNGIPATSGYAEARHVDIAEIAETCLGRAVPCLYGGSVNLGNCAELTQCPHIDGLFIGRAAWDVAGYLEIVAECAPLI